MDFEREKIKLRKKEINNHCSKSTIIISFNSIFVALQRLFVNSFFLLSSSYFFPLHFVITKCTSERKLSVGERKKKKEKVKNGHETGATCLVKERGKERKRERGKEGKRERGKEGKRERGKEGKREREKERKRERGKEGKS